MKTQEIKDKVAELVVMLESSVQEVADLEVLQGQAASFQRELQAKESVLKQREAALIADKASLSSERAYLAKTNGENAKIRETLNQRDSALRMAEESLTAREKEAFHLEQRCDAKKKELEFLFAKETDLFEREKMMEKEKSVAIDRRAMLDSRERSLSELQTKLQRIVEQTQVGL